MKRKARETRETRGGKIGREKGGRAERGCKALRSLPLPSGEEG